jgi:hypothetical protein
MKALQDWAKGQIDSSCFFLLAFYSYQTNIQEGTPAKLVTFSFLFFVDTAIWFPIRSSEILLLGVLLNSAQIGYFQSRL